MVADLRKMQENQWISEDRIDKSRFVEIIITGSARYGKKKRDSDRIMIRVPFWSEWRDSNSRPCRAGATARPCGGWPHRLAASRQPARDANRRPRVLLAGPIKYVPPPKGDGTYLANRANCNTTAPHVSRGVHFSGVGCSSTNGNLAIRAS